MTVDSGGHNKDTLIHDCGYRWCHCKKTEQVIGERMQCMYLIIYIMYLYTCRALRGKIRVYKYRVYSDRPTSVRTV